MTDSVEANLVIWPELVVNLVVGRHDEDLSRGTGGACFKYNRGGPVKTPLRLSTLVVQTQTRSRINDLSCNCIVLKILIRVLRIVRHHYGGTLILSDEHIVSLILKTEEFSLPNVDDGEASGGSWPRGSTFYTLKVFI